MNDILGFLFVGGFVLLGVLNIAAKIYNCFDHTHYDKEKLRPDAKIIDVKRRVVGGKNDKKICTTVTFDDGFEFDSYKTDRDNSFFSYRIQVSKETSEEILNDAIRAHQKACGMEPKKREAEPVVRKTAPVPPRKAPEPAQRAEKEKTLEAEFLETYLQTRSKPLGDEETAWNWMVNRILYFKRKGLGREELWELERNIVMNLSNCYQKYFEDFLTLAGDMTPIVLACEQLLEEGRGQEAKKVAEPYLKWLLAHPEKYDAGHYCVQCKEEAMLCYLEGMPLKGPRAEDNYTAFLVLYCRILDHIMPGTKEEIEAKEKEKEHLLWIAAKLSPCNATVWEAMAKLKSSQNELYYQDCIDKALRYSVRTGEPYGLGTVYGNLAIHYAVRDPELAKALCIVCRRYGGEPIAAEYVLRKRNVPDPVDPDALLRNAGIQIGFSQIVMNIQNSQK